MLVVSLTKGRLITTAMYYTKKIIIPPFNNFIIFVTDFGLLLFSDILPNDRDLSFELKIFNTVFAYTYVVNSKIYVVFIRNNIVYPITLSKKNTVG